MEGIFKIYQGRAVPEDNFRAYVYAANGDKKLVNSWREFEKHIQTGLWFEWEVEEKKEAQQAPKRTRKKKDE